MTAENIKNCIIKYENRPSYTISSNSGIKLIFTEGKQYNLDEIMFYYNKSSGKTPLVIFLKDDTYENKIKEFLVYASIDYLKENYITLDINGDPILDEYGNIIKGLLVKDDLGNYNPVQIVSKYPGIINLIEVTIEEHEEELLKMIPINTDYKDGLIYMETNGEKTIFNPREALIEEDDFWNFDFNKLN